MTSTKATYLRLGNYSVTMQNAHLLDDDSHIRNLGIIAHIDAGKTTTTERMLYYSGHTRRIGDVDEGSTVTDFLPAERARGITIQSAAITFDWPAPDHTGERSSDTHQINLIDTPGHADFTFEVRRSLRVLDGAICILDGVAGVEAQTEQVWNQAGEWKIPRIVYVNKLDRDGAAFGKSVREVGQRLGAYPAVCQIPWFEGGKGAFTGIVDVVNLRALKYDLGSDGKSVKVYDLHDLEQIEPDLASESKRARIALVERLSEHDEGMVEKFLEAEDHMAVAARDINNSLARLLAQESCPIIPVFAGASFRNIGVQPLLDAVNLLLPGPEQRPDPDVSIGPVSGKLSDLLKGDLVKKATSTSAAKKGQPPPSAVTSKLHACALAFKVVHDARKGVLVYFRVYHGSINRNDLLFNTNLQVAERATNLLRMYASDSISVQSIRSGQIGVIAGSKHTRTGDTLISYEGNKSMPPQPLNQLHLRPIQVPPPVFFAAIEPNSLREEKDVQDKLKLLLREDPSLCVTVDEDTGQTLLSGMGELHLEIANDRLVKDLKANARMGPIVIGYRETLTTASDSVSKVFDRHQSNAKGKAGCTAKVLPWDPDADEAVDTNENTIEYRQDSNLVTIRCPTLDKRGRAVDSDCISLPGHLSLHEVQSSYLNGALAALGRGPSYSFPLRNVHVDLTLLPEQHIFGTDTTTSSLSAAARIASIAAFRDSAAKGASSILEPVMNVDISVEDASLGAVVQDISSRMGGQILSLGDGSDNDVDTSGKTELVVDVKKIYAPKDPFETRSSSSSSSSSPSLADDVQRINMQRTVKARVPLKEMVGYLKHLRSMTGGRGTFVMKLDRFERVVGPSATSLDPELHTTTTPLANAGDNSICILERRSNPRILILRLQNIDGNGGATQTEIRLEGRAADMNELPPSKRSRRGDGTGKREGEFITSPRSPQSPRPRDSRRDDKSRSHHVDSRRSRRAAEDRRRQSKSPRRDRRHERSRSRERTSHRERRDINGLPSNRGERSRSRERDRNRQRHPSSRHERQAPHSRSRSPTRSGVNDGGDGGRSSFRHRSPPPARSSRTTTDHDRSPQPREKRDKERKPPGGDNRSRLKPDPDNDRTASRANGDHMVLDEVDEEALLRRMMGFTSFKTTQNTKVPGNQIYGVRKEKKTEYRQYMNRVGGFNRPLSPSRS
ncbi:hypothetical protein DV737_g5113, partial [Chaetothyriales sp. CBS 132003]